MDRIQARFDELADTARAIFESMTQESQQFRSSVQFEGEPPSYHTENVDVLDGELVVQWSTSVQSLLFRVFGADDPTYNEFIEKKKDTGSSHNCFKGMHSVFLSAKDQYEGGHLFDIRNLVHADVFANELEQAKHLLDKNWKVPAAVIAGTVLETSLREMCSQHANLAPADNINRMNDDLVREAVYNNARKQQITAWAAIRNNAAHGKPDEFEPSEVARMIDGIRDFVAIQMQ